MSGYIGTKSVTLSTTSASVGGDSTVGGDLTVDTNTLYVDSTNNNVGIGTTSLNKSSSSTALTVNTGTAANYSALELSSGDTLNWHINANNGNVYDVTAGSRNRIFYTNGSERLRILSSGGITFNGDTAAANALDDYEEGTWTPSITNHSGSTSGQTVGGRYTKIGNICHFQGVLTQGSGSVSGAVHLAGFPFSAAGTYGHISINTSSASNLQMSACRVVAGANSFQIKEFDGDSVTSGTGDVNICFEGTFQVT